MNRQEAFAYVCEQTEYDETSKSFLRWKFRKQGRKPFSDVGCKDKDGYYYVSINRIKILVHRVIFTKLICNLSDDEYIDHIDGNRENNRISNLRIATKAENMRNMHKFSTNTSGVTGVCYDAYGDRWVSTWRDPKTGKSCRKNFPIKNFGDTIAYNMACEFRKHMIDIFNEGGAGYTDRHGA